MERLPYGASKSMTDEEKLLRKRYLHKRWRDNHPDFCKAQSKYYYALYKQTKPKTCVCKYCHQEFNAPRDYYKICPNCLSAPKKTHLLNKLKAEKRKLRLHRIEVALKLYGQGLSQIKIGALLGVTQKCVSTWVCNNRYKHLKGKKGEKNNAKTNCV